MLSMARMARMSGFYTLAGVFNMLLTMVFSVIATRAIGIELYGILALGMTVFMLLDRIGLFGLDVYAQKFLSGKVTGEMRRHFGAMVKLNIIVALALSALLLAASPAIALHVFLEPRMIPVLRILAVSLVFFLPLNLILAVLRARHLAVACAALMALRLALKLAALLLLFLLPDKLLAVTLGSPLACSLSLLAGIAVLHRHGLRPDLGGSLASLGTVARGSAVMLAIRIGHQLSADIGKMALGRLASSEAVGIYSLSTSLAVLPGMFHGGTVTALMPDIAATFREQGCSPALKESYHFANALTMFVGAVCFIVMLLFGDRALAILYNLGEPAYTVFCILAARGVLTFFTGATGAFLIMTGHQRVELANSVATTVLTLILSVAGARQFGIHGVAVAGLITTLALNTAQIIEIRFLTGFMAITRLHLWMLSAGIAATLLHFGYIHHQGLGVHLLAAPVLLLMVIAVFGIGIGDQNRRRLLTWLKQRLSRIKA